MKNLVALVGKANVGKSTLFNRIVGKKISITDPTPGVTRDRIYENAHWNSKDFTLIDTGGIQIETKNFQELIRIQLQIAIEEAQILIWVLDGTAGIDSEDHFVLNLLRKSQKKIILVANKLDNSKNFDPSIYELGFEKIFGISALHGQGVGDLLDFLVSNFEKTTKNQQSFFKLAIIGRPNAGKSSLLNRILGQNRSIISDIPGTTRDSISGLWKIEGQTFEIIDTAGIKKKSKLVESVDFYALLRAFRSLDDADLSLILIDATQDLHHFDLRIAGYAWERNKPIIIVINKWDLIEKNTLTQQQFVKKIREKFKFLDWAPIVFISAKTGEKIHKLAEQILETKKNLSKKIPTNHLNQFLMEIQLIQPHPNVNGKKVFFNFISQISAKIPSFVFFVTDKNLVHFSYQRYIDNQIRKYFDFFGCPIKIIYKNIKKSGKIS
ncbi:ribosome biogenesis GTPase Der [Mesomycoplasma ovipneumoniae]|uniref:GTPase Der n=1 Tax=Mesomycoplasma ovipneumoniae TaxID=29562 RepID=A0AAJ2UC77_9BACT|nr:ribosome biogenesis GTPase Der [Mesomycoplasma ovipneumoniae]MDW2835381.1 ribosome biogenesis GTPase Der [Mesomycoplasma ovipneumoniae]MDW2860764.1 ribosome biogenesis GTPase Der [Mesomycoplasma ovipneumoniae]MDW2890884.1 ribosome biogenesis GTPase Der [Mesomycoplasma ovipneumoniae]MDW2891716.1 ribosome biogenesis GTPase Der [Mesomycoplasma ovipneumoniae]MDW2892433.1 ribosome biogenesis GTPase Der [Mesomycoplasma ovipneumoniae]